MTEEETMIAVGTVAQIPLGEGREFVVNGKKIAVFRPRTGGLFATQAECPHRNAPLCEGIVGGTTLVCPFHSWKFDLQTGLGMATNPGADCLTTYAVTESATGEICIAFS